jgi:hypothetical protein
VTIRRSPDEWDREDELRIVGDHLEVHGTDWWFSAQPKHSNYGVETVYMTLDALRAAVAGEPHGGLIFEDDLVFQSETARDAYLQSQEESGEALENIAGAAINSGADQ